MEPSKFEISDYLDSNEMIGKYLNEVIENGNETDFVKAIEHVAKANDTCKIADKL
jgi:DNA-binding phage protein